MKVYNASPMRQKLKIIFIFVGCLFFRLLPLRAPNVEPIMASIMPVGKKGPIFGFIFGFLSIFLYDLLTNFGFWTFITAITYGAIGMVAFFYFQKFKNSRGNFMLFAFLATIFYDLITGVFFAPIFGQTILNALILQIPFTALHLAGNLGFAFFLSPIINKWLISEKFMPYKRRVRIAV